MDKPLICEYCVSTNKMYSQKNFGFLCVDCERIKWLIENNLDEKTTMMEEEMKKRVIYSEFISIITSDSPHSMREFLHESIPPRDDEYKIIMVGEKQYVVKSRQDEIKLKMAYVHGQSDVDFTETLLRISPDGVIALFSSGKSWNEIKHHFKSMDSFIHHLLPYVAREEPKQMELVKKFVQLWYSMNEHQ